MEIWLKPEQDYYSFAERAKATLLLMKMNLKWISNRGMSYFW
ncbi:hypothetical protein J2X69_003209 [Algoriphagus sp. 4150]|nr:hypothetical protein [Algoriphagus sp. 4150]